MKTEKRTILVAATALMLSLMIGCNDGSNLESPSGIMEEPGTTEPAPMDPDDAVTDPDADPDEMDADDDTELELEIEAEEDDGSTDSDSIVE